MTNERAERALWQVAKNNDVTVDAVRREIEIAINVAQYNPDPLIQAFWKSVPRKVDKLTVEEAIAFIAGMVEEE